jgi:hypothetical protein
MWLTVHIDLYRCSRVGVGIRLTYDDLIMALMGMNDDLTIPLDSTLQ